MLTRAFVRVPTEIADPDMLLYEGTEDPTGFVDWQPVTDALGLPIGATLDPDTINGVVSYYYEFEMDSSFSNWVNLDHSYNANLSSTRISLSLPEIHNNTNTFMFVHFNEVQSVMAGYFDGENFVTPANCSCSI